MSIVLWFKSETDPADFLPDDLAILADRLDELDDVCRRLGVKPLGEFVDNSDLEFNIGEEDLDESWLDENAQWVNPLELLSTLHALKASLSEEDGDEVLDEISEVEERSTAAVNAGIRVRLIAVM